MSDVGCERWHDIIAMHVFGDLSLDETTRLLAHLDGCVECRAISKEMAGTYSMLSYVDPSNVEPTASVPTDLTNKVLGDLRGAGQLLRRRQRARVVGLGVVGAIAAALILVIVFSGNAAPKKPVERTFALQGSTSAKASAVLIEQNWGTSLDLHEQGLPSGGVYTVSMKTAKGTWWTAGTYHSVAGRPVNATMACAVSMHEITGIRVVNGSGVTVLSSYGIASDASYE
jgi:predicted anti-sigma-YlaC factor YlaD